MLEASPLVGVLGRSGGGGQVARSSRSSGGTLGHKPRLTILQEEVFNICTMVARLFDGWGFL